MNMNADQLKRAIAEIDGAKATPSEKLKEAMRLLERAHTLADDLEGQVQDLKDEQPDPWAKGILDTLDTMPTTEIVPYLEAGAQMAGMEHGYTSPEFESVSALANAIAAPVTWYK